MKPKIVATLIILIVATSAFLLKINKPTPVNSAETGITKHTENILSYEIIETLDSDLFNLKKQENEKSYSYVVKDNNVYVAIYCGEKPSNGYGLSIVSIEGSGKTINIIVKEESPAEGLMTAEVLSYPMTIIKLKQCTPNFNITNTDGVKYKQIK